MISKLDPRVRLLWWLGITVLAMSIGTIAATTMLVAVLFVTALVSGMGQKIVRFLIGLIPFLVVITIVSLFPTFELERGIRMALRYSVLLGSTTLILATTNYGELTNALRNLQHPKLRFLVKPLEVFALIFGLALLTVPITAEEWQRLKEVQRARGVDLSAGNKVNQVRRGMALFPSLLLRILERIKNFSIAVIVYGYNPFQPRTIYQPLKLCRADKWITFAIVAATVVGIILAFAFKV